MTLHKFNKITLLFIFIMCILMSEVSADDTWLYKVIENGSDSTEEMIDLDNSSVDIDHELKEIKLPKIPLPNIADFTSDGSYNYALLRNDGVHQYVFDGESLIEIGAIKIELENPLALAFAPFHYNMTVTMASDDNTQEMMNYNLEYGTMQNNPLLNTSGLQQIYSMSAFKDSGEIAVLLKESINVFAYDEDKLLPVNALKVEDRKNPIAVATASSYTFALLNNEKITWYSFDGTNMVEIPAMSIALDESVQTAKGLAIKDDIIYFLHDNKLTSYKFDLENQTIEQNIAFSVTDGLTKPHAIALRSDNSDLIIVDELGGTSNDYKVRYFMYDGEKLVENESLGKVFKGVMAGLRFKNYGQLVTTVMVSSTPYVDNIRIRAYTEVPKDTQITFYMANYGDTYDDIVWHETWRVRNTEGVPYVEKALVNVDGSRVWYHYGNIERSYPSFDTDAEVPLEADDLIIDEEVDESLIISITNNGGHLLNLWNYIPLTNTEKNDGKHNKVRIKAVLETQDPNLTPRIYMPTNFNNEYGLVDNKAIIINANALPEAPVILPINPGHVDSENYPLHEGWIYTTTPTITWEYKDTDYESNPEFRQSAYQLLMFKKDQGGGWRVAYDSGKVIDIDEAQYNSAVIPTSYEPNINGPMWEADTYEFAVAVRVWDNAGIASPFSVAKRFKVLAFERPRIINLVYPPDYTDRITGIAPRTDDIHSHIMIKPNMKKEELPIAKSGSLVSMLVDSVGPIQTQPDSIAYIYFINKDGSEESVYMGKCTALYDLGLSGVKNRFLINFWTKAPIAQMPEDTLIMMKLIGEGEIGGTTVLYMPPYSDGAIVIKDTIYEDWQVVLEGSEH